MPRQGRSPEQSLNKLRQVEVANRKKVGQVRPHSSLGYSPPAPQVIRTAPELVQKLRK